MTEENTTGMENTRLWRMALQLSPQAVNVVLTSMVADSSLRQFGLPLNPSMPYMKAVEDAIYSTPEILADYGHIDLLVRTDAYTVVPASFPDDVASACGTYMQLCNADEPAELLSDRSGDASVVWAISTELRNFLARTFRNAPVQCHIATLLRYLSRQARHGNTRKLYAHLTADSVDIMVFDAGGSLRLAVTHPAPTDTDALYFIMACARQAGLDVMNDEIVLCGDATRRTTMMPLAGRYASRVMPLIFPSAALRAGREAFQAPFPLIIMPLCE